MTDMIDLMLKHTSVRRFTNRPIAAAELDQIIEAGRAASSWKNFQSDSIIVITSAEKKEELYELTPQPAILQAQAILLFVGDLNRASKAADLHQTAFDARGSENLLISSVDASLAGQNCLLAAESMGYGGVFIGMIRHKAMEVATCFNLPEYTYPIFCIALGEPAQEHPVKPRLPKEAVVFDEVYKEQDSSVVLAYDEVQRIYAGDRQTETWSERLISQFGQAEQKETEKLLKKHKLL